MMCYKSFVPKTFHASNRIWIYFQPTIHPSLFANIPHSLLSKKKLQVIKQILFNFSNYIYTYLYIYMFIYVHIYIYTYLYIHIQAPITKKTHPHTHVSVILLAVPKVVIPLSHSLSISY